ncbi:MAG: type III pantothenate kinase [Chloroflexota bacterium]|nr:type III pantothenate kinase [Lentimicrobium sp.]
MADQGHLIQSYLVIDQGNTLIKVAYFENEGLEWVKTFSSFGVREIEALKLNEYNVKDGIISSVSGNPTQIISLIPNINWLVLDHKTPVPVTNKYKTPETLGKDRLAGVVAASVLFKGQDVLVIDAGTAITYDIITRNKEYLGGSITPGLMIRFKGLHTFTGRLPLYEPDYFNELTGVDTNSSIMSGVMVGTLLEIEGFINAYKQKYPDLITILTGGDAIYFDKILKSNIFALPNLVLNGLKLILQHKLEN